MNHRGRWEANTEERHGPGKGPGCRSLVEDLILHGLSFPRAFGCAQAYRAMALWLPIPEPTDKVGRKKGLADQNLSRKWSQKACAGLSSWLVLIL